MATTEQVLDQLQELGFIVHSYPDDLDGSEVIYQEGLFQFILGEKEIRDGGLTARDVIRLLVTTLTSKESQEDELSRLFGTRVTLSMDGKPGWEPTPPVRQTRKWPPPKKKAHSFANR